MAKRSEKLQELTNRQKEVEEIQENMKEIEEDMKNAWLQKQPIRSHDDIAKKFAKENEMNVSEANSILFEYPKKYEIEGKDIPALIKDMRLYKRTLKGETKIKFNNSIDNLIKEYSNYLDSCIDSIYWIKKYKIPLKEMNYDEDKLAKLNSITSEKQKRQVIDILCKYWEHKLDIKDMPYNSEYSYINKDMSKLKKKFTSVLKETPLTYTPKEVIKDSILKSVCNTPGISARQLHEQLPKNLYDRTSPQIIAKIAKEENITSVNGAYYKIDDDIKKNIWAYTAAFIDSDGYITMDKNHNPRVGLVATGDRGKAFMKEMHKSLGIGRLHLDQKSPQDTRLINRLNFYSGPEIKKLLTKCLPHFKLKKNNAKVLLELIKIKKENKKEDWFSLRKTELFKLMKYYNHSDNAKFDWAAWDIDIDGITKLEENSKMDF